MPTPLISLEECESIIRKIAGSDLLAELAITIKPHYITTWLIRPVPALGDLSPLESICAGNRDAVMRCALSMGGGAYT